MTTLDEIHCGAPGTVAACLGELDNCRMALAGANEKHAACYTTLVLERQRHVDCSQAYKSLYEQNGQMVNETHGLATTNISLHQVLEGAYKTIEASHTRNVELERLLDGMPLLQDIFIGHNLDASVALEVTPVRLQASKTTPKPTLSKEIEHSTPENGYLRQELAYYHKIHEASICLARETPLTCLL